MKKVTVYLLAIIIVFATYAETTISFTEIAKMTRLGESLEIDSILGDATNFEDGKKYTLRGSFQILPLEFEGVEAPEMHYQIMVLGITHPSEGSTNSESLATVFFKEREGHFQFDFIYKKSDYLKVSMSPAGFQASGLIIISDLEGKASVQKKAKDNPELFLRLLMR